MFALWMMLFAVEDARYIISQYVVDTDCWHLIQRMRMWWLSCCMSWRSVTYPKLWKACRCGNFLCITFPWMGWICHLACSMSYASCFICWTLVSDWNACQVSACACVLQVVKKMTLRLHPYSQSNFLCLGRHPDIYYVWGHTHVCCKQTWIVNMDACMWPVGWSSWGKSTQCQSKKFKDVIHVHDISYDEKTCRFEHLQKNFKFPDPVWDALMIGVEWCRLAIPGWDI